MQQYTTYLWLLAAFVGSSAAQGGVDQFRAIRQEYCDRGNLCVTSFNWCQIGRQYSQYGNVSTGYCDRSDSGPYGSARTLYSPASGTSSGVVAYLADFYNLTWTGSDPAYPVQVDFTFGPSQGPINSTAPLWSRNVTGNYMQFRLWNIFLDLNDRDQNSNVSYTGYGLGWPVYFTVSQPERPAVSGLNFTETSNSFTITNLNRQILLRDFEDDDEPDAPVTKLDHAQKQWRLGVGVGVGVGVPLLLILAYYLGVVRTKKAAKTGPAKTASDRKVSELSSSDRSADDTTSPRQGA